MPSRRWPRVSFYLIILLVIALDQATKVWATASLRPLGMEPLVPGLLNLTYVRNTGIAFGMFAGQGLLVALFMIALGVAAYYFSRGLDWSGREPNIVGGCLLGGALGNLVDRWRLGYVVDFFDVHLGAYHWPVFNVADSLICLAVAWIFLRQLGGESKGGNAKAVISK